VAQLVSAKSAGTVAAPAITGTTPDGIHSLIPDALYVKDPEHGWTYGNHPGFTAEQQQQLKDIVVQHKDAFAYSMSDLTGYRGLDGPFHIELDTDKPIFCKPRRYSVLETQITNEKCTELLEAGLITPAPRDTKYASAATLPAKKDSQGRWSDKRFCIDYRSLNKHTLPDKYGMPHPDDLFQAIGKSKFYSKIDLRAGFHQIPVAEADQPKTSFYWGHALWMYTRTPYGTRNAVAKYGRVMDIEIGAAGLNHCCVVFVDDLLIHSETAEEHLQHVALPWIC